jgi:hypothetical protein
MDDTFVSYAAKIDTNSRTVALTSPNDKSFAANFTFEQPAADRLTLAGDMNGRAIRMQMHLVDRNSFLLINRGFHWIQEYPFNR